MTDEKKPTEETKPDPKAKTSVMPKVTFTPPKWTPPKLSEQRLYWVGTIPCSPMQNISSSSMDFPGFTEAHGKNPTTGADIAGDPRLGKLVRMDDAKLKKVLNELTYEVVVEHAIGKSPNGSFVRGDVFTLKDADGADNKYLKVTEDIARSKPIGCYVYIVPMERESDWPYMRSFVKLDEVKEDDPLSWGQPRQWHVEKLPKAVIQLEAVA